MRLNVAACVLILGLVGCGSGDPQQTSSNQPPEAAIASTPKPSPSEEPADGYSRSMHVQVSEFDNNQVRLEGTILGADEETFKLEVEGITAGNGFDHESTVAIAEDGSFRSKLLGAPNGLADGVYRIRLWIKSQSPTNYGRGSGGTPVRVRMLGSYEAIRPDQSPEVPKGWILYETQFAVGEEPAYQLWLERQLRLYLQWYVDLDEMHSRLEDQLTRLENITDSEKALEDWKAFSGQFQEQLQSYRDQVAQLDSVLNRYLVGTPLEGIEQIFTELEKSALEPPQRNPLSQWLSPGYLDRDALSYDYYQGQERYRIGMFKLKSDGIRQFKAANGL